MVKVGGIVLVDGGGVYFYFGVECFVDDFV